MQSKEAVGKYIEAYGSDGWAILDPNALVEMGFEPEFVQRFSKVHKSGRGIKETLFDNSGAARNALEGVWALDFLYGVARDVNADTSVASEFRGRGFQAQALVKAIKEALA